MSHSALAAILENMHPNEQAELFEKLTLHAHCTLLRHGPRANDYEYTAEAFASEAMTRALEEKRICPPELPTYVFLAGIVSSLISHEGQRPEYKKKHVRLDADDEESASVVEALPAEDDVEANTIAVVAESQFKKTLGPALREYVEALVARAGSTAEELAKVLGKPVQEIRNLDRKLARRRSQWNPR